MHKNLNIKTLKVKEKSFFRMWLDFLKPFHKLRNKEIDVLALFLYKRHLLKQKINDDKIVDKLLFDKDVRDTIRDEMGYSTNQVLSNMISKFREKGIIKDNKIIDVLIPNIEPNSTNFKLIFNFNINES